MRAMLGILLACLLARFFSIAGMLNVARGPPLTPSHAHSNAVTLCDAAVSVSAAALAVDV